MGTSVVLMSFYHMTKLAFWSWYFYALPMCMLVLGLYTFAVSVYGFLISTRESKGLISLIAVFLSIAFLGQIFSVWTAIELRNIIQLDYLQPGPVKESMELYGPDADPAQMLRWDELRDWLPDLGQCQIQPEFKGRSRQLLSPRRRRVRKGQAGKG